MRRTLRLAPFLLISFLPSCASLFFGLPTVDDPRVQQFVSGIGLEVVAVSEHRDRAEKYRFQLSDFARRDILGLSVGRQRIFISYELSRLAMTSSHYHWLLRHTLAHEIAHDVLGGDVTAPAGLTEVRPVLANRITGSDLGLPSQIKFRPYSRWAELAADRRGMEYWRRLGWDCANWVTLFRGFIERGYTGDADHPTQERLDQAITVCSQHQSLVDPASVR